MAHLDEQSTPEITVAVSTRGRAHRLPRLIEALERQTLSADRFEVVIVDNGSADNTTSVLADLARRTTINLRHARVEGDNGPSVGRNAAWRAANSEIVAFTDDDCYPQPEWLERGSNATRDHDVVVGRTLPDPAQLKHLGPFSRTMRVEDTLLFQTCNVFYRRHDLEAVGGFDEGFTTPAGEDTDLGWRVIELGRTAGFGAGAVVYHDVARSSFRNTVRVTLRWVGIPKVIAKHPVDGRRVLYKRVFWKRSHPHVILAALGLAIAWRLPIALLLTLPWLYLRVRQEPLDRDLVKRFVVLPGAFAIDLLEVCVMVRGSLKYRTFVL